MRKMMLGGSEPDLQSANLGAVLISMVSVATHKQCQSVQKLPFCYSCGATFQPDDETDRDHVPPRACFATQDRIHPLILPAHKSCNGAYKVGDERVGQFISMRHGRRPAAGKDRLKFRYFKDPLSGHVSGAVANVEIRAAIERWIRAFHAALYNEPLDPGTRFGIETPFAIAVPTAQGIVRDTGRPQYALFVDTIKSNRAADNVDFIATNNGKLRYENVWIPTTLGPWVSVFALDIYDWKDLGRLENGLAKGCVGFYQAPSGTAPTIASRHIPLRVLIPNSEPLDPFGR